MYLPLLIISYLYFCTYLIFVILSIIYNNNEPGTNYIIDIIMCGLNTYLFGTVVLFIYLRFRQAYLTNVGSCFVVLWIFWFFGYIVCYLTRFCDGQGYDGFQILFYNTNESLPIARENTNISYLFSYNLRHGIYL